jgi:hypothetical protein
MVNGKDTTEQSIILFLIGIDGRQPGPRQYAKGPESRPVKGPHDGRRHANFGRLWRGMSANPPGPPGAPAPRL